MPTNSTKCLEEALAELSLVLLLGGCDYPANSSFAETHFFWPLLGSYEQSPLRILCCKNMCFPMLFLDFPHNFLIIFMDLYDFLMIFMIFIMFL